MSMFALMREIQEEMKRVELDADTLEIADGTGSEQERKVAKEAREFTMKRASLGDLTWRDICFEEVCEAFAEKYPKDIRRELIELMAVCTLWVWAIDERTKLKNAG